MGEVEIYDPRERGIELIETERYLLEEKRKRPINEVVPKPEVHIRVENGVEYSCYRNCLDLEEETLRVNMEIKDAWDKVADEIKEHQTYGDGNAETLIIAHGIVAEAAKGAIDETGDRARLFRPVTLRPFPEEALRAAARSAKRILIPESAINQLGKLCRVALYSYASAPIIEHCRPSIGIYVEEIVDLLKDLQRVVA
jgi:2-oxoglutarate/2-oxoacid ferredoxin oxidoreductase subunit alpha